MFLFVLAAITYINTMEEIGVFRSLRAWLVATLRIETAEQVQDRLLRERQPVTRAA